MMMLGNMRKGLVDWHIRIKSEFLRFKINSTPPTNSMKISLTGIRIFLAEIKHYSSMPKDMNINLNKNKRRINHFH